MARASNGGVMKEALKSLLVVVSTTVLALIFAEAAFRIVSGKKVFALTQYRAANIVYNELPKTWRRTILCWAGD